MIIIDPDIQHVANCSDQVGAHKCEVRMVSYSLLQKTPLYFVDFLGLFVLAQSLLDLSIALLKELLERLFVLVIHQVDCCQDKDQA